MSVLIISAALLLTAIIGITVAFLVSRSDTVINTFTYGEVDITLTETTGKEYKLAPGTAILKDPIITVKEDSENCWVFVKIQKSSNFDRFCDFELAEGWTRLNGHTDIYYRTSTRTSVDLQYHILKNDRVYVKDTVTEEELDALQNNPTLDFTAYAIQSQGFETAEDAWEPLND